MDKEINNKNNTMQTVHRAIKVLKAFSRENKNLSLTDINKLTGITMSSLQRIVSTLVWEGFLHKDEKTKRYQLGLSLLFLGELVEENTGLLAYAKPVMERINHLLTESVSLNLIEGTERKCIYNLASGHNLRASTYVGDSSPLYAGASAKVLLANLSAIEQENYFRNIELLKITEDTIISKEQLWKDLKTIKEQGYAISWGERVKGAVSISAPIFNSYSKVLASLTVIMPIARIEEYDTTEIIEVIKEGAREITANLNLQFVE